MDYSDYAFYYSLHIHTKQEDESFTVLRKKDVSDSRVLAFIAAARIAIANKGIGDEIFVRTRDDGFLIGVIDENLITHTRIYSTRFWK